MCGVSLTPKRLDSDRPGNTDHPDCYRQECRANCDDLLAGRLRGSGVLAWPSPPVQWAAVFIAGIGASDSFAGFLSACRTRGNTAGMLGSSSTAFFVKSIRETGLK